MRAQNTDFAFLSQVGAFLFDELFVGAIGTLYRTSLGIVRSQGQRLRIRLRMEPPELASLPWELLFDPQEEAALALAGETALVRHVPLRLPVRPTSVEPPLRILLVIAHPSDAPTLDVAKEQQLITDALAEQTAHKRIELHVLTEATVAAISQALRAFQPHVFHFIGHGYFQDEQAYALLEDEAGRGHLVDAATFQALFADARATRLAILNACQTAATSDQRPLVGLAPSLLQRQLSAVVAMQQAITDQAAALFARDFYRSLALGYPVDAAVAEARRAIYLEAGKDAPDWAAPVLFLRAQDGQLFQIEETKAAQASVVAPPPAPSQPPTVDSFVGREAELAFYANQIEQNGIAVIAGMAGVGKTSLAARLARRTHAAEKIFWHTFRPEEGLEVIIWKLAGFLYWRGQPELWQMVEGASQNGGQLPPLEVLFDYIIQMSKGKGYLLCLDDFQFVENDELLDDMVARLRPLLRAGEVKLLLVTRSRPKFLRQGGFRPLDGLSRSEVTALLQHYKLALPEPQIVKLHDHLEGNAELLMIAIDALRRADDPHALVERLVRAESIERYLLDELDRHLTAQERAVESAAAVLGYPGTREAIETTLQESGLDHTLYDLCNRYLLRIQESERKREYDQHSILRAFYYEKPSRKIRQEMHRRAAIYYEEEEPDLFKSAWHYQRAGEEQQAAMLAANNVWSILNRGYAHGLRQLLENFGVNSLSTLRWAEVKLAQGEVYTFLGKTDPALESYHTVLLCLEKLETTLNISMLRTQAYMGLGDLFRYRDPALALEWLHKAHAEYEDKEDIVDADLHIRLGIAHMIMGNFGEALAALEYGLAHLPATSTSLGAKALLNIGNIYAHHGDLKRSSAFTQQALQISEKLHDHYRTVAILQNLGIDLALSGQWAEALDHCQRALDLACRLGDVNRQASAELALGNIYLRQGGDDVADLHLQKALALTMEHNLRHQRVSTLASLTDLQLRRANLAEAESYLEQGLKLAEEIEGRSDLSELYRHWAELYRQQGDIESALAKAEAAVALARELEMTLEEGVSLRVLADCLVYQGRLDEGLAQFVRSYALLEGGDPYEHARTKLAWGAALQQSGNAEQGGALLQEAIYIFQQLNAQRELITASQMLPG
ncbi:MAG: CHAT domain-containing protein [Caldilineaceae bacterium]